MPPPSPSPPASRRRVRTRASVATTGLVLAFTALACSTTEPTGFLVGLSSQLPLHSLVVRVENDEGRVAHCATYDTRKGANGAVVLPASLGVEPADDDALRRSVRVRVLAYGKAPGSDPCATTDFGDALVRAEVIASYVEGSIVDLPMPATLSCVGVPCDAGTACRYGVCRPLRVDVSGRKDLGATRSGIVSCYPLATCTRSVPLRRTGSCTFGLDGVSGASFVPFVRYATEGDTLVGTEFLDGPDFVVADGAITLSEGLCALVDRGVVRTVAAATSCEPLDGRPICAGSDGDVDRLVASLGGEAAGDAGTDATTPPMDASPGPDASKDAGADTRDPAADDAGDAASPDAADASPDSGDGAADAADAGASDAATEAGDGGTTGFGSAGDCTNATCCGRCVNGACEAQLGLYPQDTFVTTNVVASSVETAWLSPDGNQLFRHTRGGISVPPGADVFPPATALGGGDGAELVTMSPTMNGVNLVFVDLSPTPVALAGAIDPHFAVEASTAYVLERFESTPGQPAWRVVPAMRSGAMTPLALPAGLGNLVPADVDVVDGVVYAVFAETGSDVRRVVSVDSNTGVPVEYAAVTGASAAPFSLAVTPTNLYAVGKGIAFGEYSFWAYPLPGGPAATLTGAVAGSRSDLLLLHATDGAGTAREVLVSLHATAFTVERLVVGATATSSAFASTMANPGHLRASGRCATWIDRTPSSMLRVVTARVPVDP